MINQIYIRRQSLIDWHAALAQRQGYSPREAKQRAEVQLWLDETWTAQHMTIAEGLAASGWDASDWTRICSGEMPTYELTALMMCARAARPAYGLSR